MHGSRDANSRARRTLRSSRALVNRIVVTHFGVVPNEPSMTNRLRIARAALVAVVATTPLLVHGQPPAPSTGQRYARLLIRNVNIIDGAGNPTRGPFDIVVQGNTIASIRESRPGEFSGSSMPGQNQQTGAPDRVIDGTGMTVMPGQVDVHVQIHI